MKYIKLFEAFINESFVTEAAKFKNTKDFEAFLEEIDGMGDAQIKKIMGKDYIDTPGYYSEEAEDYDNDIVEFMISNMGRKEFERLRDYWEDNVAESKVNESIKVEKLNTLIDVLANLEDAFTEEEFVEFGVGDLDMPQSTMMDIFDTYWNLSPQKRLHYTTQDWIKWLKKNHSVI